MGIKAVVFDIGGVLERVEDDSWPELWAKRWEERAGREPGAIQAGLAEHAPAGSVVTGEVSEAQLRRMYADALGLDDDAARTMMAEMWDAYCGELDTTLFDYFVGLRRRYRTGILSNSADGARREESRRYGFPDVVDELIYSHEVGLAKPDPAIFELTCRRLRVAPHEVVLLDDVETNVLAAREQGWHAVHHVDTPRSIREVEQILADHSG